MNVPEIHAASHSIRTFLWGKLCAYLQLGKFYLSLGVALSSLVGYGLYAGHLNDSAGLVFAAILLLSMGSSGFNQIQERKIDARMERTAQRPLPTGRLQTVSAFLVSSCMIVAGFVFLGFLPVNRTTAMLLAAVTILWYNGLYTPLKQLSPFAVAPGAFVGALPPAIGYTSAGGNLLEAGILLLVLFMTLWQIPHFWLLQIRCQNDYRRAGLGSICDVLRPAQIDRILLIWVICNAFSVALLGLYFSPFLLIFAVFLVFLAINAHGISTAPTQKQRLFFLFHLFLGQITLFFLLFSTLT